MKRVARDGEAYDLFEFTAWYDGGPRARRFWQEAPPEAEHHSRREIALEGMLTMSALRMVDRRREAPPLDEVQDECDTALEGMLTMAARRILPLAGESD